MSKEKDEIFLVKYKKRDKIFWCIERLQVIHTSWVNEVRGLNFFVQIPHPSNYTHLRRQDYHLLSSNEEGVIYL